jgi:hypothetical protein
MIPTDAMDTHWVENRPVTVRRCDKIVRISPTSFRTGLHTCQPYQYQAIATPDSMTLNIKHPSILHLGRMPYSEAFGNAWTGCQVPRSDGQSRRCCIMSKVCYILAVGFVWYLPGPVDAKINMACAGLSVGTVALS